MEFFPEIEGDNSIRRIFVVYSSSKFIVGPICTSDVIPSGKCIGYSVSIITRLLDQDVSHVSKSITTGGGGLARITGTTWKGYNTSNSELPNDKVWGIAIENDENKVRVATNGGGLALLNLATAISDPIAIPEIQILPNPASQLIYLKSATEIDGLLSMTIYDAAGRMAKSMKAMNADSPMDISALPIGYYSVRIESTAGISMGKFIVE